MTELSIQTNLVPHTSAPPTFISAVFERLKHINATGAEVVLLSMHLPLYKNCGALNSFLHTFGDYGIVGAQTRLGQQCHASGNVRRCARCIREISVRTSGSSTENPTATLGR